MSRTDTLGRPLEPGPYNVNGQPREIYGVKNWFNAGPKLFVEDYGVGIGLDNPSFDNATFERLDGPEGTP